MTEAQLTQHDQHAQLYRGIAAMAFQEGVSHLRVTVDGKETIVGHDEIDEVADFAGGQADLMCFEVYFGDALTLNWENLAPPAPDYIFDGRTYDGVLKDGRHVRIEPAL